MSHQSSQFLFGDSYANSGNVTATVPSGCKLAIAVPATYYGTSGQISGGTISLGGSSMTSATSAGDNSGTVEGAFFWLKDPPTGSQTLAWDWVGTGNSDLKNHFLMLYYDDVVDSVRDADGAQDSDGGVTSPSVSASSGDLVIAAAWAYATTTSTFTLTNVTERTQSQQNEVEFCAGDATASGSISVTATHGGNADVGVIVVAFIPTVSDSTAPVLTSATGTATGQTTATVGATTDEGNGTLYAVITTSNTQPSVAQIKAGQTHTGSTAPWSGSTAVSSTGAKTINATGLTASTTYYAHLVHTDAASNDSNRITSSSFATTTKKLKLLTHSSAASSTGVAGVVFQAPTGGAITGSEIGEFTGAAFEASLESGQAVLKVAVSEFGGTSLTTSDTPVVLVRNSTHTTGIISATVVEE